ncbi:uncharacterized protein LOC117103092 [Anneissia japonica]|uniref:uncharacterized protein LOC117103092 n=1 Tax=Anneissia japonica TaxID=1529436 RepID=UPI001425843F|nr:uncharacterized protein LOC117103092 [Anneissia japonica]
MQFRICAVFNIILNNFLYDKVDVNMISNAADGISIEVCSTQELISHSSSTYAFENSSAVCILLDSQNCNARVSKKNLTRPKCTADTMICKRKMSIVLIIGLLILLIIIPVLVLEVGNKYSMPPTTGEIPLNAAEANIQPTLVPDRTNVTQSTQSINNTATETRSISRSTFSTTSAKNCEEWKCKNGNCVSNDDLCNKIDNCGDNTDEYTCDCGEEGTEFFCDDGLCVHQIWVCDGKAQCFGGEDERGCET